MIRDQQSSDEIQRLIDALRKHEKAGLQQLDAWLSEHPHQKETLLFSLASTIRGNLLRRILQHRPDFLKNVDFPTLIKKAPQLIPEWLRRHELTDQDAHLLFQSAPSGVPHKIYRRALKYLPDPIRSRFETLQGVPWHKLLPWLPALVQPSWPDSLTPILVHWLNGEPVPDEKAVSRLKPWLEKPKGSGRIETLPVLIRSLFLESPPSIPPMREILWVLKYADKDLPRPWNDLIRTGLEHHAHPLLIWLARHHPHFRHVVQPLPPSSESLPRWTDLREFMNWLDLPVRRMDMTRMQALLMELGVGIRRTRRRTMIATQELLTLLETTTPDYIKRRFSRLVHANEFPFSDALLPLLIKRRIIRRTVHPKVFEYLSSPRRALKLIRRIEQEQKEKKQKRHHELMRLIQKNLEKLEPTPFRPDPFQLEAVQAFRQGKNVLVTAPTGSGKTWIALKAMEEILHNGGRAFYSTPLRALSYQKLRSFRTYYGHENVGVLTGEYRENTEAPILVGTTEIVRNLLLDGVFFDLLVMDEAHYLGDVERGSAWEEAILLTPKETRMILLSATIPNDEEVRDWLKTLERDVIISKRNSRPVPLVYLTWTDEGPEIGLHPHGTRPSLPELLNKLQELKMTPALVFVGRRDDAMVLAQEAIQYLPVKENLRNQIPEHPLSRLLLHGVGAHHAGLSYTFRAAVENLLEKGELKAVFCTSSLAHGIDAPVRTTILYDVSPFWERSHLQHAMGRAGRRGFDRVGFAIVALPPWNIRKIVRALKRGSEPLQSAFAPHDASVAGLINRYGIDGAVSLARKSLRTYQGDRRVPDRIVQTMQRLIRLGFMERDGSLTENGHKLVRLMHPNGAAIVLVLEAVRQLSAEDAALIAAFFCNERPPKRIRKYLKHPFVDLMTRITRQVEVETDPRDGARRAWIIQQWLRGKEENLRQMVGVEAEGDLERFRIQVIELLRKLENLDLPAATEALSYLDPYFEMEHPDWRPPRSASAQEKR